MAVRPPSLRSLAAFEAAARHGSFARAAAEMNLTPGAISHAIRSLETRLGGDLFERVGRGVALTPLGGAFAARVRVGLSLIADAVEPTPASATDRLVVSALPSIAAKLLTPGLAAFQSAFPGVRLEIRSDSTLEGFERGDVDVAIRFGPGSWAGLKSRILSGDQFVPVASPAYLERHPVMATADLASARILHDSESSWRLWQEVHGPVAALPRTLQIDDAALLVDAAVGGHGVALAREVVARRDLAAGRLRELFDRRMPTTYVYACVWSGNTRKEKLVLRFVEWLEELFRSPAA